LSSLERILAIFAVLDEQRDRLWHQMEPRIEIGGEAFHDLAQHAEDVGHAVDRTPLVIRRSVGK
jgi:hypothetical protein